MSIDFSQLPNFPTTIAISALSLILSFILIVLYGKQTDIQNTQTNIMRSEHRPIVDAEGIDLGSDESSIIFMLRNVGNEVAIDPTLTVDIDIKDNGFEGNKHTIVLIRDDQESSAQRFSGLSRTIPVEASQSYTGPIVVDVQEFDGENYIHESLAKLFKEGVRETFIEIGVTVENVSKENFDQTYISFDLNLEQHVVDTLSLVEDSKVENMSKREKVETIRHLKTEEVNSLFSFHEILRSGMKQHSSHLFLEEENIVLDWTEKMDMMTQQALREGLKNIDDEE